MGVRETVSAESDALAVRARELRDEVAELRLAVQQQGERLATNERATNRGHVAIFVLVALLAVLGWIIWETHQNAERLEVVTQQSLCPFYGLIVGSYDPASRALNPDGSYPGSAREKYDQGFQVMRGAFGALGCHGSDVLPKRAD
jgi:hypothetical protein